MSRYSDLFSQARNNYKRIENIDKKKQGYTFYHSEPRKVDCRHNQKIETEPFESFSIRMIIVMLVLVTTMFFKQAGIFNHNSAYEAVMAEVTKQLTIEEIESAISESAVYPVMNWFNDKK